MNARLQLLGVFIIGGIGAAVLVAARPTARASMWKYKQVQRVDTMSTDDLNILGQEGWELIGHSRGDYSNDSYQSGGLTADKPFSPGGIVVVACAGQPPQPCYMPKYSFTLPSQRNVDFYIFKRPI